MAEPIKPDKEGYLEVKEDNVKIYWQYFGKGEKEVIVLMNGLAMHIGAWQTSLPFVYPEFDVLLYDYRGQLHSTCDDAPYSIPRNGDYLAMIMDLLKVDKVHTMGVSYGGFVAAEYGRLYPDRVHSQTISGILLTFKYNFRYYHDFSMMFYTNGPKVFELYSYYLYEKIFSEKSLEKFYPFLDKMRGGLYEKYVDKLHCLIRLTEAQDPFFESLEENMEGYKAVKAPTLIMAGDEDRLMPIGNQTPMLDIYPNSKLILLPECGHMTYLEYPKIFWGNLLKLAREKSIDADFEDPGKK